MRRTPCGRVALANAQARWYQKHKQERSNYGVRWREEQHRRGNQQREAMAAQGVDPLRAGIVIVTRSQLEAPRFTVYTPRKCPRYENLYELEREITGVHQPQDPLAARGRPLEKLTPLHQAGLRAIQRLLENHTERQILEMLETPDSPIASGSACSFTSSPRETANTKPFTASR